MQVIEQIVRQVNRINEQRGKQILKAINIEGNKPIHLKEKNQGGLFPLKICAFIRKNLRDRLKYLAKLLICVFIYLLTDVYVYSFIP